MGNPAMKFVERHEVESQNNAVLLSRVSLRWGGDYLEHFSNLEPILRLF